MGLASCMDENDRVRFCNVIRSEGGTHGVGLSVQCNTRKDDQSFISSKYSSQQIKEAVWNATLCKERKDGPPAILHPCKPATRPTNTC